MNRFSANFSRARRVLALCVLLVLGACGGNDDTDEIIAQIVETGSAVLSILSNRADLISGDDVLIGVLVGDVEDIDGLVVTLNGVDVTDILQASLLDPRLLIGLVEGLRLGENTIAANIGNSITVTNNPIGGPIFSGPQIQPWECQSQDVDPQCNQAVTYEFLYRSSAPGNQDFKPYDPANPPGDIATTTPENKPAQPFIVRKETGYLNRDQYAIYTLHNPDEPWTASRPQSQWNGRLLVTHGGNCRPDHNTDEPAFADFAGTLPASPEVNSYVYALSKGWSVLSAAQLNLGHNCNLAVQAETLMMVKERFVEQYGLLRYTVGTGCSGGAITQLMIANAYPGLYQGLLTACTYPGLMSTATQFADYHMLLKFFGSPPEEGSDDPSPRYPSRTDPQFTFTPEQQAAVMDHQSVANAELADRLLFSEAVNPSPSSCDGVPDEDVFDQDTNKTGVRCDVLTYMENILGLRQPSERSALENELGVSFVGYPLGNIGVQYGLKALRDGEINPKQFVHLNVNIGGLDPNLNVTTERLAPDTGALGNAFRSGIANTVVNLDTVAIINFTGPDPGAAHDSLHGYWVRRRLDREFGHHDNHVMWGGPQVIAGDIKYMRIGLEAMKGWLDAVEADNSDTALAQKIVSNKPGTLKDQCGDGNGNFVRDGMCTDEEMLVFGTPRTGAGGRSLEQPGQEELVDYYGDNLQCSLRPFSREDDYGLVPLLEEDWLALQATFADGVCDFRDKDDEGNFIRPQQWQRTVTWLTYQDSQKQVITGGVQLPAADYPPAWTSPAFYNVWEPGWLTP